MFETLDDLAKCIMFVMNESTDVNHDFGKFFGNDNVTSPNHSTTQIECSGHVLNIAPEHDVFFSTKCDKYYEKIALFVDLSDISGNCFCDIVFDDDFKSYEVVYSNMISNFMKHTGKTIYELDETDWAILKFKDTINGEEYDNIPNY